MPPNEHDFTMLNPLHRTGAPENYAA